MKLLKIILSFIIAIQFMTAPLFSGDWSSSGGDFVTAINRFLKIEQITFSSRIFEPTGTKPAYTYCQEFKQKAIQGLSWLTNNNSDIEEQLFRAEEIANKLCESSSIYFGINLELIDKNLNPLTAINRWDGETPIIELNSKRWDSINLLTGDDIISEEIQTIIATHELLSLVGLESTGNYNFSSVKFLSLYRAYKSPIDFLTFTCEELDSSKICQIHDDPTYSLNERIGLVVKELNRIRNNSINAEYQAFLQRHFLIPGFLHWNKL